MEWLDFSLKVPAHSKEQAEYICTQFSHCGIYIEDYTDVMEQALAIAHINLVDSDLLTKDKSTVTIHTYFESDKVGENPALLCSALGEAGISYEVDSKQVQEEDWANSWKQFFHKIEIGDKLLICPEWEKPENSDRAVMVLEPGLAFGTGTHPTTALCLEKVEQFVTPDTTVLDLGCGSGILSIGALLLGAKSAVGVDIDEKAVKTAVENASRNGFTAPQVQFIEGNLADKVTGQYSLVVANIVADVILILLKDVSQFLAPGGTFIVSGIIDDRVAEVCESFDLYGFKITAHTKRDEWNCFVLEKV